MENLNEIVGVILREKRKKLYTQQQLADVLSVSRQTINKLENGQQGMTFAFFVSLVKHEIFTFPQMHKALKAKGVYVDLLAKELQ